MQLVNSIDYSLPHKNSVLKHVNNTSLIDIINNISILSVDSDWPFHKMKYKQTKKKKKTHTHNKLLKHKTVNRHGISIYNMGKTQNLFGRRKDENKELRVLTKHLCVRLK